MNCGQPFRNTGSKIKQKAYFSEVGGKVEVEVTWSVAVHWVGTAAGLIDRSGFL